MDAATKWGQSKSNSLVFNTFIFMQVHTVTAMQQRLHMLLIGCTQANRGISCVCLF